LLAQNAGSGRNGLSHRYARCSAGWLFRPRRQQAKKEKYEGDWKKQSLVKPIQLLCFGHAYRFSQGYGPCLYPARDEADSNYSFHLPLHGVETFWRQLRHAEFDISECSLSTYTMVCSRSDERFIAIPAFMSPAFRHSSICVNTRKGISVPQDLKGRVVGVPEYRITAAVWVRGILQDEYGIFPGDMTWRTGGQEVPGRVEKVEINLPPDVKLEPVPSHMTLTLMVDKGDLDAVVTAGAPPSFMKGSPNVKRLFVEEQYFRKTGVSPSCMRSSSSAISARRTRRGRP
jgi:hypothetical protein